jgi:hypothetical protein
MKRAPQALKMKEDNDNYPLRTILYTIHHHEDERLLQPMLFASSTFKVTYRFIVLVTGTEATVEELSFLVDRFFSSVSFSRICIHRFPTSWLHQAGRK